MTAWLPIVAAVALATEPPAPATPPPTAPATAAQPTPPIASDPTPAQLFQRAIACVGPIEQAPCLRAEGVIETAGGRSDITLLWNARAPRRIVVRERLSDGRVAEWGASGERGWMRAPGREAPIEVEPAAVLASKAALVPSLMVLALADRFPHRTSAAIETIEGVRCHRVDLEDRDGLPGAAWFDTGTGRLRAFQTRGSRNETPTTTTIEAWTSAGALQVPSRLVCRSGTSEVRTTFSRLSVEPIADEAFAPPVAR